MNNNSNKINLLIFYKLINMYIIDEFIKYDENYMETFEYITKHQLKEELDKILTSYKNKMLYDKLFEFSYKYGIVSIIKFLYEIVNYEYDVNIFDTYISSDNSDKNRLNNNLVTVGDSNANNCGQLKFSLEDKWSIGRRECILYLMDMKKYSIYHSKNKKFYYRYNKKKYG